MVNNCERQKEENDFPFCIIQNLEINEICKNKIQKKNFYFNLFADLTYYQHLSNETCFGIKLCKKLYSLHIPSNVYPQTFYSNG